MIPLVEMVPAPWTEEETVTRCWALMEAAGMEPVRLTREIDGFIANRLQAALLWEAFRLLEGGYATAKDIDTTISAGLGRRWSFIGPFETIDLNAPGGLADFCARLGEGFYEFVKQGEPAQPWSDAVVAKAHEERRGRLPMEDSRASARRGATGASWASRHTSATRAARRGTRSAYSFSSSQLTIHLIPNRSVQQPKYAPQEHFLRGSRHLAALGQPGAQVVALLPAFGGYRDGEVVAGRRRRAEGRRAVAAHQHGRADGERHVHDPVLLGIRHVHAGRAVAEGLDHRKLAAEDRAVEFEHLAAVAVEEEIDVEGHSIAPIGWMVEGADVARTASIMRPGEPYSEPRAQ